ncbi:oxysterol-binding protein-related protein 10 isoform X2 [Sarcophilus harrisii]|uniref:oxysterol-binding protein-related protein 10 isoform X2 n=1 Tax=Sarcophilus harrisii TaxID=9305 RepID=UPI001301AAFD|nr:oxysterol-binding protein-related protein 10 isoform X2 [Sarcophilus harrisii]
MEKAASPGAGAGEGAGSGASSRSSSRATSAGSSPSGSWAARGAGGRRLEGGSHSSPGSVAASPCGAGGRLGGGGRRREPALEGVLSKYTNLLQGWQNRYFMLDFESGVLQYFVNEQSKSQKPRGTLSLAGAIVSLSDEAPHMLVVYSANGEVYKLRAADAKEKQCWVTQLQNCAKYHMEAHPKSPPSSRSRSLTLLPHGTSNSSSPSSQRHLIPAPSSVVTVTHHKSPATARRSKSQYSAQLHDVREMMSQVEGQQKSLVRAIEALPGSGPLTALDQDLLLLKATSAATLSCLGECLSLLQQSIHQVGQYSHRTGPSENPGWQGPKSHSTERVKNGAVGLPPSSHASVTWAALPAPTASRDVPSKSEPKVEGEKEISTHSQHWGEQQLFPAYTPTSQHQITSSPSVIQQEPKIGSASSSQLSSPRGLEGTSEANYSNPLIVQGSASQEDRTNEEETDNEENGDENADNSEDHHSIVLHLISQLRFGMDLTKVALPTFILETRSLLEMFANFMAHPDLLLSIGSAATPEERAISFVEYYLTSFREGRKGSVAKKPYNPILGEIFHCSWDIPKDQVKPLLREQNEAEAPAPSTEPDREHSPRERYKLRFVAEQVSHHPPVSCFYCECKERGMFVNTHVWTKSKFMGMSVGVSLLGEGVLRLLDYEEDYIFTLPNAYARSILTIPWVELGGKVTMECAKTGYTALVTFHTKPFYGGKVHRVTAEVKHKPSNTVVCKAQGEWNGVLEFTYSNGETKLINTAALPVYPKKVRPIEKQEPMESRNLWREVTNSIKVGDMNSATEFKRNLEDKQRKEEQERASRKAEWRPRVKAGCIETLC